MCTHPICSTGPTGADIVQGYKTKMAAVRSEFADMGDPEAKIIFHSREKVLEVNRNFSSIVRDGNNVF